MRKSVKTGGGQRADYLRGHTQNGVRRHRSMLLNPRIDCLTLQILRDIDELLGSLSEIQDLYDIDVMELLGRACLFLKLLLCLRVETCDRDELQGNWFARAVISGLVSNRCAGSADFSRFPFVVGVDAVVAQESCVLHIRLCLGVRA